MLLFKKKDFEKMKKMMILKSKYGKKAREEKEITVSVPFQKRRKKINRKTFLVLQFIFFISFQPLSALNFKIFITFISFSVFKLDGHKKFVN
jgi:uncharacterized membrane protein YdjX (TVP38/TMEM64 family)